MDSKSGQQHKIMRQVLEVRGCVPTDAQRVQSELRDVYYRRLLPAIEKTCSALSTPRRIHRIDLLDIDLGEVPPDALESAVADRFDRVFASELAAAMGSAESAEAESDLELFSYFVRTGTLPWWADRSDRRLLETSLDATIRRAPRALRRAIESAPDQKTVWRRIALAYPDRLLDELLRVLALPLAAAYPGLGAQWVALLDIVASARGSAKSDARNLWWEELLRASSAGEASVPDAPRFFGAVLLRLASRLEMEYGSLVASLYRALDHPGVSIQPWARDVVASVHRNAPEPAASVHETAAPAASPGEELARLLEQGPPPGRLDDDARASVMALVARLPAGERAQALARIRRMQEGAAPIVASGASAESRQHEDRALEGHPGQRDSRAPVDLRFSDTDEIYVENAGLVILWPFLENFFAHLGVVEAKQFRDAAARQRAVGLLQYVAAEEAAAPEYLVPLNKVLCGMPLDEVFDFGPPITAEEIDACTDLVTAAIHHAPVLREMSIRGFRGSFLLRQGQLSVRDGNWLLRVERETHDIVLDRFPWSARIVKLPWMEAIMVVEW